MNNLFASLYETFFDWNSYENLLRAVFDNSDYGKLGLIMLLLPLLVLVVFYKLWDPINKQKLKWILSLVLILIVSYGVTSGILYSNAGILQEMGNYSGDNGEASPTYFVFQMGMISLLISSVMSLIYFIILKRFSTNNSYNPF